MAIDFPNSPSTNATFSSGGNTWKYDGSKWVISSVFATDATTTSKGIVQLAGDLAGTAASPQIAAGAVGVSELATKIGATPTYETSLPSSPPDGQEIYFAADATNSVIWHLRWRSAARSSSGAWEYLGGAPMRSAASVNVTGISATTRTAFSPAVTITLPAVTGDYDCEWGAQCYGDSNDTILDLIVDGSTPTYPTGDDVVFIGATSGAGIQKTKRVTSAGISKVIEVKYRVSAGSAGQVRNPWLTVRPVRVW